MTDQDRCGEPTAKDEPCQRPEGFGRDADHGPCYDHVEERPVLRKFTEGRRETILGAAESGAFKKHVAQLAGIKPDTLNRWLEMGETDAENSLDTDLSEFYRAWQRARGRGAVDTLRECSEEFLAERAYGYTKTEQKNIALDSDADVPVDDTSAEFVTYESDGDGEVIEETDR